MMKLLNSHALTHRISRKKHINGNPLKTNGMTPRPVSWTDIMSSALDTLYGHVCLTSELILEPHRVQMSLIQLLVWI